MKQVNLYEAKTSLSALVEAAEAGEVVIIAKNGKPKAKLVAVTAEEAAPPKPPEWGYWGKIYGWNAPEVIPEFTEQEIDEWYNNPVFPENLQEVAEDE